MPNKKPVCKRCIMIRWVMVIGMLAIMASIVLLNNQAL